MNSSVTLRKSILKKLVRVKLIMSIVLANNTLLSFIAALDLSKNSGRDVYLNSDILSTLADTSVLMNLVKYI